MTTKPQQALALFAVLHMVLVTSVGMIYTALDETIQSPFEYRLFAPQLWVALGILLMSWMSTTHSTDVCIHLDQTLPEHHKKRLSTSHPLDGRATPETVDVESHESLIEHADRLYNEGHHEDVYKLSC